MTLNWRILNSCGYILIWALPTFDIEIIFDIGLKAIQFWWLHFDLGTDNI